MKINISIMRWINRIIMIPFIFALLSLIVNYDNFFYTTCLAFAVGCFQVFSSLMTLFYYNRIKNYKQILAYLSIVFGYFIIGHLISKNYKGQDLNSIFMFLQMSIPVLLAIFWTYIIESIKKEQ